MKPIKANGLPYINAELYKEPSLNEKEQEHGQQVRQTIAKAFSDIMDRAMIEFDRPEHRQWIVQDAVMLILLLGSIKIAEQGGPLGRREILSAFNHLLKRSQHEIPENVLAFAREALGEAQPS